MSVLSINFGTVSLLLHMYIASPTDRRGRPSLTKESPVPPDPTRPGRYRKKPVEIIAMKFDGTNSNAVIDWINGDSGEVVGYSQRHGAEHFAQSLIIETLEGSMRADVDDWLIRGVQGEFYPCKPTIFAATYEPVEEAA